MDFTGDDGDMGKVAGVGNDARRGGGLPWHFWLVGLGGLVWNGYGAVDHVLIMTGNPAYLKHMPQAMVIWVGHLPVNVLI